MAAQRSPIRRKKPLKRKALVSKPKLCRDCGHPRKIWSHGLCQKCASLRKKTTEEITFTKVDTVFSWLVRTLYPNYCHACKQPLPYRLLQCCHMIPKSLSWILRWDIKNCYPGCENCNYHDQTHEIRLAAECDRYWGSGTADHLALMGKKEYHWAPYELEELYYFFLEILKEAENPDANKEELRERVWGKTSRII